MNLEPLKTDRPDGTEIRAISGLARLLASLTILSLATLGILVVLDVIPRAAFAEVLTKTAMIVGSCGVSVVAIGFLARR